MVEQGRGPFLKNTKRSSLRGPFGRFGYVKAPRARGERARWVVAAPCLAGRAGGGRAWALGARHGAVIRAARSCGSRGSRQGRQATGRARRAARPSVCGRSRGSAGRWDALRTHVAPGGGKPRRVGAGGAAPGAAALLGGVGGAPGWLGGGGPPGG